MDDPLVSLERALEDAQNIVDGVRDDQLGNPTPCEGWDVRTVLNHLVGGNRRTAARVTGGELPDMEQDHLGSDFKEASRSSNHSLLDALRTEGALDRVYQIPAGQMPGRAVAAIRMTEALAHGWDIAKATGQSTDIDPVLCEHVLVTAQRLMMGRERTESSFGPEQPAPEDATAADRLAAYLGRPVQ